MRFNRGASLNNSGYLIIGLVLALSGVSTASAAQSWTVSALLRALAQNPTRIVHFKETNHLRSLRAAVHFRGTLAFIPPDTLLMKQNAPHPGQYKIVGNQLYVGARRRSVPVDRVPAIEAMVSGFEGLLSGNRALLMHDYRILISGSRRRWRLTLTPRLRSLQGVVKDVVVRGQGGDMTKVTSRAPDGDYAVIRISP